MSRGRLEAFSDGVLAVVITIMVLNLRPPAGDAFSDLRPLLPKLAVYFLSFVFVAIYWNNHHHLFQVVDRVSGPVLWANAGLLFCLSLIPVGAAWLGPHLDDTAPTATYGVVLLAAAIAYGVLVRTLIAAQPPRSPLERAIGNDRKGNLSIVGYVAAIGLSPVVPWLSLAIYFGVAAVWLVPDRRMERVLPGDEDADQPEGRVR